jgi:TetR/AcrR family transcriptional repressor of mexJK operon
VNSAKSPSTLGRPKDLIKRQAILESAKRLFLEQGYDGSSMDAIAKAAGVSKLTVYNHFHDKENLFVAAVEAHCENQLPALEFDLKAEVPIELALLKNRQSLSGHYL